LPLVNAHHYRHLPRTGSLGPDTDTTPHTYTTPPLTSPVHQPDRLPDEHSARVTTARRLPTFFLLHCFTHTFPVTHPSCTTPGTVQRYRIRTPGRFILTIRWFFRCRFRIPWWDDVHYALCTVATPPDFLPAPLFLTATALAASSLLADGLPLGLRNRTIG